MARIADVRQLSRMFVTLLLLTAAVEVRADCGAIDYACKVDALAKRVDLVKTSKSSAAATLDTIGKAVPGVQSGFDTVSSGATVLSSDASEVLAMFKSALDTVESDALTLSTSLVQRADDARKLVEYKLQFESRPYTDFVGSNGCSTTCEAFRGQLVELIGNYQNSVNLLQQSIVAQMTLEGATPPQTEIMPIDLSYLSDSINRAPGFALFPLHQALMAASAQSSVSGGGSCAGDPACASVASLNELLEALDTALKEVSQAATADATSRIAFAPRTDDLSHNFCTALLGDDEGGQSFMATAALIQMAGSIIEVVGEAMIVWGMEDIEPKGGLGVGLNMLLGNERKATRAIGSIVRVLGAVAFIVGSQFEQFMGNCRADMNHQLMLCYLSGDPSSTPDLLERCRLSVSTGEQYGL